MINDQIALANETVAREVAQCLDVHYPNHLWAVNANVETGIVTVHNLACSGQWGFVLHMSDMVTDPSMKLTIRAGGELLERYNISRSAYKEHEFTGRARTLRGDLIHET